MESEKVEFKFSGMEIGEYLMKHKAISKLLYSILMDKNTDMFSSGNSEISQEVAKRAIHLSCVYGPPGSLRWIFSTFAIELKEADLPGTSLLLFTVCA